MDLLGMEAIWRIALGARDQAVMKEAVLFLTALQHQLHPSLADRAGQFRKEYILTCCRHLRQAALSAGKQGRGKWGGRWGCFI